MLFEVRMFLLRDRNMVIAIWAKTWHAVIAGLTEHHWQGNHFVVFNALLMQAARPGKTISGFCG